MWGIDNQFLRAGILEYLRQGILPNLQLRLIGKAQTATYDRKRSHRTWDCGERAKRNECHGSSVAKRYRSEEPVRGQHLLRGGGRVAVAVAVQWSSRPIMVSSSRILPML